MRAPCRVQLVLPRNFVTRVYSACAPRVKEDDKNKKTTPIPPPPSFTHTHPPPGSCPQDVISAFSFLLTFTCKTCYHTLCSAPIAPPPDVRVTKCECCVFVQHLRHVRSRVSRSEVALVSFARETAKSTTREIQSSKKYVLLLFH